MMALEIVLQGEDCSLREYVLGSAEFTGISYCLLYQINPPALFKTMEPQNILIRNVSYICTYP